MDLFALLSTLLVFHLSWSLGHTLLSPNRPAPTQYTRELLLHWNNIHERPADLRSFPEELLLTPGGCPGAHWTRTRTRKRGRRGGTRLKKNQPLSRIPLPSIILSNAQSLRNKTEELQEEVHSSHDFKDACILAFSETFFSERDSPNDTAIDGFGSPFRQDRDAAITGKSTGGGVCLYINERWCNAKSVTVRERLCTPDVELLSVSLRPGYLPREFPQIFITVVYIHPKANEANACEHILRVVQKLQLISPDAPNLILGDMNHCSLKKTLRDFHQYVTCPTRKNNILDMCFGNVKDAYKSVSLAPLGLSDHNCVHLIPVYRTALKRGKVQNICIKNWSDNNACETLQGLFEATDWDMFLDSAADINELTDVVTSWSSYCESIVIPDKIIKVYPNSKPWISKSLRSLLQKKRKAFREGNTVELRSLQKEIKREVRIGKNNYKSKIEAQLRANNLGSAWDGMKTITGLKDSGRKKISLDGYNCDLQLAQSLNDFYGRFDTHIFRENHIEIKNSLLSAPLSTPFFEEQDVITCFKKCNPRKSAGPDHIGGRLLKTCAEQLGPIFYAIFNLSLSQQCVPSLWKQSTVIPVAKVSRPKTLNDFRPVALTSLVMKQFERLIKSELVGKTESLLDPYQFAYREGRGVQDATATLLNLVLKHLENNKTEDDKINGRLDIKNHARLLFIDFSSAFNTIQPHVLVDKLLNYFSLDPCLVGWILDFLTNRSQQVRVNDSMSSLLSMSTGSPQGCVLSALLFILYTDDCRSNHDNRFIIKYADDSVIVSLLNNEEVEHGQVTEDFLSRCKDTFLELNISKTKELLIDFRRGPHPTQNTVINGQPVEIVPSYKYLGTIIDSKLKFDENTDMLCKKGQQRLFCLRKLARFHVDRSLMKLFYSAYIHSVISFSLICWYGNLSMKNKNSLGRIVKIASKITGIQLESLELFYKRQVLKKALSIQQESAHPLNPEYQMLPSGSRLGTPKLRNNRFKFSFVPVSIDAVNSVIGRGR